MKKRLLLLLFIFVAVFSLTGCTSKKKETKKKEDAITIKINKEEVELTGDEYLKNMHYKSNGVKLAPNTVGYRRVLTYKDSKGDIKLLISMAAFTATYEQITKSIEGTISDVTIGDITYKYYEMNNYEHSDMGVGTNSHAYMYEFADEWYVISFVSKEDTRDLEATFLSYVTFEEETK